jgi:hypothetical protein
MLLNKTHIKSFKYAGATLLIILLLQLISYAGFLRDIKDFIPKYLPWIIYLDISILFIGAAIYYILSYKSKAPCMTGMMVGMTLGMQVGMMIGAVIGATSGFFTGAMAGMLLGSIAGIIAGTVSTSSMSWLQGLMAGIMGGTMGPMISVMIFTDRIHIFMPFYILLNIIVLIGFMKMYHEEIVVDNKDLEHKHIDLVTFASATIIFTAILMAIMIYGPKSLLFV